MRLATYNVENLFNRAKVMNLATWSDGRATLNAFAGLNALLGEQNYTAARKQRMLVLLRTLGLDRADRGPYVVLRRNRGSLLKRLPGGGVEIVANGRTDWIGSLDLIEATIDADSIRNTARVVAEVNADVLAVVEAEDRPSLVDFNDQLLSAFMPNAYAHVMLVDGNDERGIDVALLTRPGFPIGALRSHVDDRDAAGRRLFSRDCALFTVEPADAAPLVVLVNHLKSKGFGSPAASNARRRAQAVRVAEIYRTLRAAGQDRIAVVGDLNDTPTSAPLAPLLRDTDLRDAFLHPAFDNGGYPGTFGGCTASTKLDYLLLSPALFASVSAGGVVRSGMWPGVQPRKWPVLDTLVRESDVASDHAALWVDLAI